MKRSSLMWLMIAACAVAVFKAASGPVSDPDLFWHLKTGEVIWATGQVPRTDPFSWTVSGTNWVAHEWLWQAALYPAFSAVGWRVVPVCAALGALGVFSCLAWAGRNAGLRDLAVEICLFPALLGFGPFVLAARPQIASYVLFAAFVAVLEDRERRRMWLLPLLEVVWANTHASFVLGPALIGLYCVAEAVEDRRVRRGPLAWMLVTALAAGANPRGLGMYAYTLSIAGNTAARAFISEWQSPDFHGATGVLVAGVWLALDLIALAYGRRKPLKDALIVLAFAALTLSSIRHGAYFVISSVLIVSRWLNGVLPERSAELSGRASRVAAVLSAAVLVLVFGGSLANQPAVDPARVPVGAVDYIVARGLEDRLWNQYVYGGYLIFRGVSPFIDGRADVYLQSPFFREVAEVETLRASPEALLDKYGVERVLTACGSMLDTYLTGRPGWGAVYRDGTAVVFAGEGDK